MALDAIALALEIQAIEDEYNEQEIDFADLPAKRFEMNQRIEQARFDHITTHMQLTVPGVGLNAGSIAVTGVSITGTVQ